MPSFSGKLQWKCEISDKEIVYKRMKIGIQLVREREKKKKGNMETQTNTATSGIILDYGSFSSFSLIFV